MDSEKILRLSSTLKEMTLQKIIEWNLDCKRISLFPDNNVPNVRPMTSNSKMVIDMKRGNDNTRQPWMEYVFSSPVDEKVFRLIGVLDFIEEEIKSAKLQLWNKDVHEYEFPDHPSFKELFQLVREIEVKKSKFYLALEAENFVDKLLKESHGVTLNRQLEKSGGVGL
jgi:hypothetical protein